MAATYAQLTTNERVDYHRKVIDLHNFLLTLNLRYQQAITSQEKTALRNAAAPVLTQLSSWTYDSVAGTHPDE